MNKIGIIIPVFNKIDFTKKCLHNLNEVFSTDKETGLCYEIIVVDDASTDGTGTWIKANYSNVHVLNGDGNLWWSGGINMGAEFAIEKLNCNYLLLWNNDIQVEADYFKTILHLIDKYDTNTIIGSKIFADNNKKIVWSMGGSFDPIRGHNLMNGFMVTDHDQLKIPTEADWLTGMGTLVPAQVVKKIGYWDQINFPQYYGDAEFTYRAKTKGFKNIVIPELIIWNDITNTGLKHGGNLKTIFKMLTDKRSLYNFKVNLKFYNLYAKSPLAYIMFTKYYGLLFGGFIKWKILGLFGKQKSAF
jgi:GT2 family glycosyltransferase